jgi:hypothetical protein
MGSLQEDIQKKLGDKTPPTLKITERHSNSLFL